MTYPSTVADTLDAAADLLSKPGAWTQGTFARAADGSSIRDSRDPQAVCWCMYGALIKTTNGSPSNQLFSLLEAVTDGPLSFNDAPGRTQDEVVAKLREAAAKARGEVQP